jgi:ribose transport system substrate-binding protein
MRDVRTIPWALSSRCLVISAALATSLICSVMAQEGPPGITKPEVFQPFNPDAPACSQPPGLRKAITFAQDNGRKFMQGVASGLELAAKDRRLTY